MIFSAYEISLLFFAYSFLGWCVEVAYVAITIGRLENRGFLNGPVCPIYGCGMLGVLFALLPFKDNWVILFFGGALICSTVECIGGFALDKIFHMRWWDYSDNPFNLNGYICLSYSIMWGMGTVFVVKFIHPSVYWIIDKMPDFLGYILIVVSLIVFIVDMIVTLKNLMGIKKNLGQLDIIAEEMNSIGNQLKDVVGNSAITVAAQAETGKEKIEESIEAGKEKLEESIEAGREKFEENIEATKEKLGENIEVSKEKYQARRLEREERYQARMLELEEKRLQIAQNIQKYNKKTLNKLPRLNKLGKSINIREYINSLKYNKK